MLILPRHPPKAHSEKPWTFPLHSIINVRKCHTVPKSRFRVRVLAPFAAFIPPRSACAWIPPLAAFLAAAPHHSLLTAFPTPLILDAICNSFSGLSYLCGASQACPVPALLSVYHNCTSVKNKLSSIDLPSCCLHNVGAVYFLQFCPRCLPCCDALAYTERHYASYTYACER